MLSAEQRFITTGSERARTVPAGILFLLLAVFGPLAAGAQSGGPGDAYRLIGTIGGSFSGAVLSDGQGMQTFYRLREVLPDGSRITGVAPDSIRVQRSDGSFSDIYVSHDMKATAASAPPAAAARPEPVVKATTDAPQPVITEKRAPTAPIQRKRGYLGRMKAEE